MRNALGAIGAALLGGMVAATTADAAVSAKAFVASPAAQAYKAKDYERALRGFEALLAEHPDDPLILRYIGITLDRLGRSEEALEPLSRALELSPDSAAVSFYLGLSLYKLGRFSEAEPLFKLVMARAPGTRYAANSRDLLSVIVTQSAPVVSPAPDRRFDVFAQAGFQYDDSTGVASGTAAWRAVESVSVGYNVMQSGPWLVRFQAHGYANQHIEETFRDRDIDLVGGAIEASYATELGSVAVVPAIRVETALNFQDYETFSYTYGVGGNLDIGWTDWMKTAITYTYQHGEFEDRGLTANGQPIGNFPQIYSRDGTSHNVGVTQSFIAQIDDVTVVAHGGYQYSKNMAVGSNFDAHGDQASGGLTFYFPDDVVVDLSGRAAWNTRPRLRIGNQDARLETETVGATATIAVPINDRLRATLSYDYAHQSADFPDMPALNVNAPLYEYTRNIVTIALSYTLN